MYTQQNRSGGTGGSLQDLTNRSQLDYGQHLLTTSANANNYQGGISSSSSSSGNCNNNSASTSGSGSIAIGSVSGGGNSRIRSQNYQNFRQKKFTPTTTVSERQSEGGSLPTNVNSGNNNSITYNNNGLTTGNGKYLNLKSLPYYYLFKYKILIVDI